MSTTAVLAGLLAGPASSSAKEYVPVDLLGIGVDEKLGADAALAETFTDHRGQAVSFRDLLDGERPVLLTLNWYRCRMLCNLQLNALLPGVKGSGLDVGADYRIVTVSIDPTETAELAARKRSSYLRELGWPEDADWTFLVGSEAAVRKLADTVGFRYRWDEKTEQFAHSAAVYFLAPKGVVARYLYGLEYLARDVRFALLEAAEGRLGGTVDRFLLSCFHYDAALGSYQAVAWRVMRLGGLGIMLGLSSLLFWMWRIEVRRRLSEVPA